METTLDNHVDEFNLKCPVSSCKEKRKVKSDLFAFLQLNFQRLVDSSRGDL